MQNVLHQNNMYSIIGVFANFPQGLNKVLF